MASKKLFVGSLPFSTTDDELKQAFSAVGAVEEAKVIMDRQTGRSRGFGFVTMATEEDSQKAVQQLNGSMLGQRKIFVSEAREQERRDGRE